MSKGNHKKAEKVTTRPTYPEPAPRPQLEVVIEDDESPERDGGETGDSNDGE